MGLEGVLVQPGQFSDHVGAPLRATAGLTLVVRRQLAQPRVGGAASRVVSAFDLRR
jgi:hypothetical protein